ncbi:class I SAM-dependent methyltransferase [Rhodospirillum rubrum]|uniref:Methylase involved in ubiquinone/menaquinone biosynthesis-like n=1 Tax=Rhodospirillum rubrum (strain ATCC 11170 / ATH 1.1.1 / DSM 467 / LMG 4362 / NCIMB 8255 / S1) TaxID=269796 RepID=Q2RR92_RHORT|nr:class I SAM-dependent methyltransferase [Rhodospirillum rubrum]ABC23353.1 Methylase involved in ubiquinone/menaquinone biosynthesis-like [Rhodospirillum rubrum ATCC 11170]AEO49086.1 ubiquinone/menaquinone biosynthesis methylase-like protein [Rhodospirillum rubrum F11]MBK5954997.1 ubiquinone/menaquinone biosynthesis methyltransferase [Rhodospirillum rubrum]QXG79326.1 class I SAM-dependent methyltransferase [Rhodospirillum rubrum]HAQ01427.1 class I SAM-dependent methyltransferase [Rhodospiril
MTKPRGNTEVLLEALPPAGRALVDVGCGDGALARVLAAKGARSVLGFDVADRQLALALAAPTVAGVAYVKAGAQAMPLAEASVDGVIFFNSLHHIPQPLMARALGEAARVIRPGGLIYVAEPIAEGPNFEMLRPLDDETQVRAQAQACLDGAEDLGLRRLRSFAYRTRIRRASFDEIRLRFTAIHSDRDQAFAAVEPALRLSFERLGVEDGTGGRVFDQPMRAALFTRP